MREIKFRLRIGNEIVGYEKWDIGTGDNAGWFYCKNPTGKYPENVWRPDYIYHTEKDQYTGLPDKNGKEIYEGNLLTYPGHEGYYLIKWVCNDADCGFTCERDTPSYNYMLPSVWKEMTVVGNIYENPELIKEK